MKPALIQLTSPLKTREKLGVGTHRVTKLRGRGWSIFRQTSIEWLRVDLSVWAFPERPAIACPEREDLYGARCSFRASPRSAIMPPVLPERFDSGEGIAGTKKVTKAVDANQFVGTRWGIV